MLKKSKGKIFLFAFFVILFLPRFVLAFSEGEIKKFFVDPSYDSKGREELSAILEKVSQKGYFFLEKEWSENLTQEEKKEILQSLNDLAQEFDNNIYPNLTSIYGSEWKPGIDFDYRITILFHQMKEGVGGYFRSEDEYPRVQSPNSNEREMVYLNIDYLKTPAIKGYLAHEFTHLITFNQKDRKRGVSEEIWLNEGRAELAITLLGYDKEYQGSNLQRRVAEFLSHPSDSLTEWQGQKEDYGVLNVFFQYLLDHYGSEILRDSLQSSKVGIPSINEALRKNGYLEDFSQIFTDWLLAIYLNDCRFGERYCYKNENLRNLKITPSLIFLPPTQKTEFSLDYSILQWSGNWYRVLGGEGDLRIKFEGDPKVKFTIPYVLCKNTKLCSIDFLQLDKSQKGEISFQNFGREWTSITLIPTIQSKTLGFNGKEPSFDFSLSAEIKIRSEKEELIAELKAKIAKLKAQIAKLQAKIAEILREKISCKELSKNLYFGMRNSQEVRCLQEFLKAQGPEIYPQGLVTGNFLNLTKAAVIRFQEKYAEDILAPWGLTKGTGYVGETTRAKINELLK